MKKVTLEIIQRYISEHQIELASTHVKLCIPIIDRIYKKMLSGVAFSEIKVDKNHICDGHHRYFASLLANVSIERINWASTSATKTIGWKDVIFIEEDWDTPQKIKMLNEMDANFNNMSIGEIEAILK